MAKRDKKPKKDKNKGISAGVPSGQIPRAESTQHETPLISLGHIQQNSGFGLNDCELRDKAAFADRLYQLCLQTWADIQQAGRQGQGCELIPCKQIKANVPLRFCSEENALVFRFSGKKPMVGFRESRIYHVVWLDHDFSLYNHG